MGTAEILQGFFKHGATAALVLDGDGQVLGKAYRESCTLSGIEKSLHDVLSIAPCVYKNMGKGELECHQVYFDGCWLRMESLGQGRVLVLVLDAGANSGRIRVEIRKIRKELESEISTW